jgi:hypothetical protein
MTPPLMTWVTPPWYMYRVTSTLARSTMGAQGTSESSEETEVVEELEVNEDPESETSESDSESELSDSESDGEMRAARRARADASVVRKLTAKAVPAGFRAGDFAFNKGIVAQASTAGAVQSTIRGPSLIWTASAEALINSSTSFPLERRWSQSAHWISAAIHAVWICGGGRECAESSRDEGVGIAESAACR